MAVMNFEHYPWWLGTVVVVDVLYYIVSPWCSKRLVAGYSKLSDRIKVEWHTITTSCFHSLVVTSLAFLVLMNDDAINKDVVWGKSYYAQIPIAITLGFITADFFIMLFHFPLKEAVFFMVHHILTAIPFWSNITYGPLTYFAVFRILAELSTPFVNLRWMFDVLDMKSSRGYMINGFLLMASFFLARIAVMPQYYYSVYLVLSSDIVKTLTWSYLLAWVGGSIGLDVLNIWWFRKIFRGAMKLLQVKPAKEENADSVRNRVKGE